MPTAATHSPRDFKDLYTDLLNKAREDTTLTATVDQAKRYINEGLLEMQLGYHEKLPWLVRDAVLITSAPYTTGTVTINQGSTTLTGIGTAWDTNNSFSNKNMRRGGLVKISGSRDVYRVDNVTGDTAASLQSAFISDDITTGVTYEYFEDQYSLAGDFMRPVEMSFFDSGHSIQLVGRSEFRQRFPRNNVTGKPTHATIVDEGAQDSDNATLEPRRSIRLSSPPVAAYNIPYSYVTDNICFARAGTARFVFTGNPANTDTITIGTQTMTFVTSLSGTPNDEIVIGVNTLATIDAAVTKLNASALADVDNAVYLRQDRGLEVEYAIGRSEGDTFAVSESSSVISVSTSTLTLNKERSYMIGDWDVPLCPPHVRSVIVDLALYRWYLYKKDDARAQQAKADADTKLSRLVADSEIGSQRPRLVPSVTRYKRSARKPYSPGSSTKYDINGRFDRLEDR